MNTSHRHKHASYSFPTVSSSIRPLGKIYISRVAHLPECRQAQKLIAHTGQPRALFSAVKLETSIILHFKKQISELRSPRVRHYSHIQMGFTTGFVSRKSPVPRLAIPLTTVTARWCHLDLLRPLLLPIHPPSEQKCPAHAALSTI